MDKFLELAPFLAILIWYFVSSHCRFLPAVVIESANFANFNNFWYILTNSTIQFKILIQNTIHFDFFHQNSIQQKIQLKFYDKIQFKRLFNNIFFRQIQFKNLLKTLKLAVFNSTKYSFN